MSVPARAPEAVRDGILRASRVLFTDPGLAATALRTTVEGFLTSEGISETKEDGGFRGIEDRIAEWRKNSKTLNPVANAFFAVKWIGNAGAHRTSGLTVKDVLLGAGILGEAFHKLFTASDIEKSVRGINRAKGPVREDLQ